MKDEPYKEPLGGSYVVDAKGDAQRVEWTRTQEEAATEAATAKRAGRRTRTQTDQDETQLTDQVQTSEEK